jgi:hypothetical protein
MAFVKTGNQRDESHQRTVFLKAQKLLRDHDILMRALGSEGMQHLGTHDNRRYLDNLSTMVLDDNAEALGRVLIDQIIHYVWALAEQEIRLEHGTATH